MSEVYVVGVAVTPFGRFIDMSVKRLTQNAVTAALADAQMALATVDAAFFANTTQAVIEGQHYVPGQVALRAMGFERLPIVNVENACASGSTALHLAHAQIKAGLADVALAVGVEKVSHEQRDRTMSVFDGAWDIHEAEAMALSLSAMAAGTPVPDDLAAPSVKSPFMDIYASLARFHMSRHGTTQRQMALVTSKNRSHASRNPNAQFTQRLSVDEVLAARVIAWPLTLPMCSPVTDGAAAAVLCSEAGLKRLGSKRAIRILASAVTTGSAREPGDAGNHIARHAARQAYEQAGVGPEDVDVAEVHDASAFAEILQVENMGFCETGAGGWLTERGVTALGGRLPVNPSGGLESRGHPIGATGLAQVHELVLQLRGEAGSRQVGGAPRIALAENGGGFLGIEEAVVGVTLLGTAA